ncbi:conserved protein of unknown function [Tenacibaculum sp. 190524A02b]|uniref:hypothetical protein n=1 Tax=Tenacibaculum vairaonense TaxID=3137860 RepID=UPI0032B18361
MKKIVSFVILALFSGYWGITFFFTAPDNYLKISQMEGGRVFKKFFFQKWGFFAPPPTSNDRLYCVIHKKSDSTKVKVLELIKPVIDQKISKAPFNNKADLLDYVLSNNFIGVNDEIRAANELIGYMEKDNGVLNAKEKDSILIKYVEEAPQFKALQVYAKKVAKKNGINEDEHLISLRLTYLPIPKFGERNNESKKMEELLVFQSRLF